jgi:hypothetical protein
VEEAHSTPWNSLDIDSAGFGTVCSDHVPEFPRMAVAHLPSALLYPTAMHAVITLHETPLSLVSVAPSGLGVVWIDQPVSFHDSTSEKVPDFVVYEPAATQEVFETQWSDCNSPAVAPAGASVD